MLGDSNAIAKLTTKMENEKQIKFTSTSKQKQQKIQRKFKIKRNVNNVEENFDISLPIMEQMEYKNDKKKQNEVNLITANPLKQELIGYTEDEVPPASKRLYIHSKAFDESKTNNKESTEISKNLLHLLIKFTISAIIAENGNTIFHELVANGDVHGLNDFVKSYPEAQLLLQKAINDYRETPVHYACKLNKCDFILPLINLGCSIHIQNINGQTGLHIALENHETECIEEFRKIIKEPNAYTQVEEQLKLLFQIYNDAGHTVLHHAVLQNRTELVRDMLIFCKRNDIDPCQIEVLGSGNTILHLAATQGLEEMFNVITGCVEDAIDYTNYAGDTVGDMGIKFVDELLQVGEINHGLRDIKLFSW